MQESSGKVQFLGEDDALPCESWGQYIRHGGKLYYTVGKDAFAVDPAAEVRWLRAAAWLVVDEDETERAAVMLSTARCIERAFKIGQTPRRSACSY